VNIGIAVEADKLALHVPVYIKEPLTKNLIVVPLLVIAT
jgi:hypothetical protein